MKRGGPRCRKGALRASNALENCREQAHALVIPARRPGGPRRCVQPALTEGVGRQFWERSRSSTGSPVGAGPSLQPTKPARSTCCDASVQKTGRTPDRRTPRILDGERTTRGAAGGVNRVGLDLLWSRCYPFHMSASLLVLRDPRSRRARTVTLMMAILLPGSAFAESKPKVFVTGENSFQVSGAKGDASISGVAGSVAAEGIKIFLKECQSVELTTRQDRADYIVSLSDDGSGPGRKGRRAVISTTEGRIVFVNSTRSLKNAVKDSCRAIDKEWMAKQG